jgi:Protein of unknown function (DUF3352)
MFELSTLAHRRHTIREELARVGLASALLIGGFASVLHQPAAAQDSSLLSVSAFAPKEAILYAETKLDTQSDQLVALDAIVQKLGSSDSLIDEVRTASDPIPGVNVDLEDAEVGIAIMPSAFEDVSSATSDLDPIDSVDSVTSDVTDIANSTSSTSGIVLIVKPIDIAGVKTSLAGSSDVTVDSTYKDIDIYAETNASSDSDPSVYAIVGDNFVVAGTVADIQSVIDTKGDPSSSIGSIDQFKEAAGLLPQERVAYGFANGVAIIDLIAQAAPEYDDAITDMVSAWSGYTGLAVIADDPGLQFDAVNIPADGMLTSAGTADNLDLASKVPADTSILASGYDLGQSTALKGLGLLFAVSIAQVGSDTLDGGEATPVPMSVDDIYSQFGSLLGFNLKTDFIDQMTGAYGIAAWNLGTGNIADASAVITSGVDNPDRVDSTISTLSLLIQAGGQGQLNVTSRPVEGGNLNNVVFDSSGTQVSLDYGIVGDQFILGVGDGATAATEGSTNSLADSDIYQTALSYLPKEFQSVYFANIGLLNTASQSMDSSSIDPPGLLGQLIGTPVATPTAAQSFAAVSYVKDGYSYISAVIVVP